MTRLTRTRTALTLCASALFATALAVTAQSGVASADPTCWLQDMRDGNPDCIWLNLPPNNGTQQAESDYEQQARWQKIATMNAN
ncbi:hypothetical protein [Nocardia tengchongensis]|uniref:hypothetical protein n=1 Tax=Nocardia tengchongensis TaxID=2055889 RepID=UPI0036A7E192